MNGNSIVVPPRHPVEADDPLTNILRSGARQLLAQAVEMEAEAFLAAMKGLKLPDGRDRLVRHGYGPVRTIHTGIGGVEVARVKILDRPTASGFASPRQSCRCGHGARRAWTPFWRATSRRRWRHSWGGRAESFSGGDLQTDGGVAGRVRAVAEARSFARAGTCTYGRTASSCRLAWKTTANACWC
jgi:hypothetical protein